MIPIKVATASLNQTPLDWIGNQRRIEEVLTEARAQGVTLLLLPELCTTGYGCEDAFLGTDVAARAWSMLIELVPANQRDGGEHWRAGSATRRPVQHRLRRGRRTHCGLCGQGTFGGRRPSLRAALVQAVAEPQGREVGARWHELSVRGCVLRLCRHSYRVRDLRGCLGRAAAWCARRPRHGHHLESERQSLRVRQARSPRTNGARRLALDGRHVSLFELARE